MSATLSGCSEGHWQLFCCHLEVALFGNNQIPAILMLMRSCCSLFVDNGQSRR
jgi:hypothetical protein